jgi:glycosyltransferase involved in cell wall biosynthesis
MEKSVVFAMNWPDNTGLMLKRAHDSYEQAALLLQAHGYKCFIAYPRVTQTWKGSPLHVVELNFTDISKNTKREIKRFVKDENVVHIVYIDPGFLSVKALFFKLLGIKTTAYCRYSQNFQEIESRKFSNLVKKLIHKVGLLSFDQYWVINKIANTKLSSLIGIPSDKITLINNGLDCKKLQDTLESISPYIFPEKSKVLLSIFQMRPQKNIFFILKVIKALLDKGYKFHYCHIGGGEELTGAKKWVADNNISKYVDFVGKQDEVFTYLKSASLLIHANEDEAHGNVITEALICDVPVVAVSSPGSLEQIDETVGAIIPQLCVSTFVDTIEKYLSDETCSGLNGRGVAKVQKYFSIDAQASKIAASILEIQGKEKS